MSGNDNFSSSVDFAYEGDVCADEEEILGDDDVITSSEVNVDPESIPEIWLADVAKDSIEPLQTDTINIHVGETINLAMVVTGLDGVRRVTENDFPGDISIAWYGHDEEEHFYVPYLDKGVEAMRSKNFNRWITATAVTNEPVSINFKIYLGSGYDIRYYTEGSAKINVLPAEPGVEYKPAPKGDNVATSEKELYYLTAQRFTERSKEPIYFRNTFDFDRNEFFDNITEAGSEDYLDPILGETPFEDGIFGVTQVFTTLLDRSEFFGSRYIKIVVDTEYCTDADQQKEVNEKINEIVNDSLASVKDAPRKTKIQAISKWIKKNVKSITSCEGIDHTIYGAFFNKKGTCQARALLFERLCREMGIPSRCISDYSRSMHMYNIVQLEDGKWYQVEPIKGKA